MTHINTLEQQVQVASSDLELLKDEELEAIGGRGLDNLLKNLSLRGKVARWAAVAVSVVGISIGMAAMPAQAINRVDTGAHQFVDQCKDDDYLDIHQGGSSEPTMCFANAGGANVLIADVHSIYSGNNAGYFDTNKGTFRFEKGQWIDFIDRVGTVTILHIHIN